MGSFHGTPVLRSEAIEVENPYILTINNPEDDISKINLALTENKLILIRSSSFEEAGALFGELVDHYGLRDSYDIQMQYVVTMMEARDPVDNVAVTVNKRGPYQIIQPHCEGDSTSQLDLFGLYCMQNAKSGGENILSLINQTADHSRLRAKEKAIVDSGLSPKERNMLRGQHPDAKDVITECPSICRVLLEKERYRVIVRPVPIKSSRSVITGENLITYWDNVTVHDHAFHRYHHSLLKHLGILHAELGTNYEAYMHVEDDSSWAPADTDSGDIEQTSKLFTCHVLHKLEAGDFLVFNNRPWTHSVNNWPPDQVRKLNAMYA